jgi:ABC-2 type transport system permease protein
MPTAFRPAPPNASASTSSPSRALALPNWKKYATVAAIGWQDSLVYRLNALTWIAYTLLPSLAFMLVWLARYGDAPEQKIGGFSLGEMIAYYLLVTLLAVAITPHPEYEVSRDIRLGKVTQFLTRPIGFWGYLLARETAYQIMKTGMALPAFAVVAFLFRASIRWPAPSFSQLALFVISALGAFLLLMQIKYLLAISAFWLGEVGGILEIWNILIAVFAGRLLPLDLLPSWARAAGAWLPFHLLFDFPMRLLLGRIEAREVAVNFGLQVLWAAVLGILVRVGWKRGLRAYEAYGG